MSVPTDETILPVEETVAHKTNVLDWSQVASETCNLEFRDDAPIGLKAMVTLMPQVVIQMALVSLVAWLASRWIGRWLAPLMDHVVFAALAVVAGVAWAIFREMKRQMETQGEPSPLIEPATWVRALLPLLAWQAIILTAKLDRLAGAYCYCWMVTLPVAVLFFDRFATHAVHWYTASKRTDDAEKTAGRDVWADRVLRRAGHSISHAAETEAGPTTALAEAMRVTDRYRWGVVWLALAFLIPSLLVAVSSPGRAASTAGLQLLNGVCFGLLVAVLLRCGVDPRIVPRFFAMLVHWLYYGWEDRLPPWVFQSPCGRWPRRQLATVVLVALLAIPHVSLAAHSFFRLGASAEARGANAQPANQSPDNADSRSSTIPSGAVRTEPSWLWIAPTVLVAFFIPTINFFLMGLLLAGPVISAYYDVFEAAPSFSPHSDVPREGIHGVLPGDEGEIE